MEKLILIGAIIAASPSFATEPPSAEILEHH